MSLRAVSTQSGLAIHGGPPVRTRPFAPWPQFADEEIEAAAVVLRSGKVNYWTGENGPQFEQEFAAQLGCRGAVAVANGTLALELALYALGIGPGDEVIVPSRTFVATASCILMRGGIPVFADVDRDSGTLTSETVRPLITGRTRAIIPVHLAGWPCDMDPLLALAREHQLRVIEDCAQAHGAFYKGRPVGALGDAAAFSFCQDKIISTGGEGGMFVTSDEAVWERAWSFKDHGKNWQTAGRGSNLTGYRWVHDRPGTNWRMTEMQSAIGRVLLRKVSERVAQRQKNATVLSRCLSCIPALRLAVPPPELSHAYYKYYAYVCRERLREGWNRDRLLRAIAAEGIPCSAGSCSEIYCERAFAEGIRPPVRHAVARELGESSLMFQVHPTLSEEDMLDVCRAVEKVMEAAAH